MALIKTNEEIPPEPWLRCPHCTNKAWVVATRQIDDKPDMWRDFYWCRGCHREFSNAALLLWCADTGEFYAYREAVSDAK